MGAVGTFFDSARETTTKAVDVSKAVIGLAGTIGGVLAGKNWGVAWGVAVFIGALSLLLLASGLAVAKKLDRALQGGPEWLTFIKELQAFRETGTKLEARGKSMTDAASTDWVRDIDYWHTGATNYFSTNHPINLSGFETGASAARSSVPDSWQGPKAELAVLLANLDGLIAWAKRPPG